MPPVARPDTVLKRAEELIGVGQSQAALQALHDIFTSRRFKQTPLSSLEPIVLRFIDLCVELKRGRTAKDGLVQYKNASQNSNPASIELVINHFLKLANQKVVEAQEKANHVTGGALTQDDAAAGEGGEAAAEAEVDDLEESETPESMLLGSVSVEESKDRTDRVLVTPWLKFLWEAYRTALDILKNNARLELPYQQVAHQALKFCLTYQRKTEFRRLCELMRNHLQNVSRFGQHNNAINLTDADTLQRHLDTRFAQLNSAVELELWQEAFRSVEDVHNLLTTAKKAPRPTMMANYYEKLARIFLVSDNALFHAAAWNRYYSLARLSGKSDDEQAKIASYVLLSALAVPVISSSAPGTGNLNRVKTDFLQGDVEGRSRTGRLTALLGLQRTPTRAGLLKEALMRNVLKKALPEIRELYHMLEVEFHPLSICAKIQPIIAKLAADQSGMGRYVKQLHSVILTRLFQQLSQVYDKVKLTKVMDLVSPFEAPYNYTAADIERFALNACKRGHLNISIDHLEKAITFQDDVFQTDLHPSSQPSASGGSSFSANAAIEADSVRLQSTPSELVRTQLQRLAYTLDTTIKVIDPTIVEIATRAKREAFAHAIAVADQEHRAAVARKAILARRKELLTEKAAAREKDEAVARAERARAAAEAERKRIEEENRRREQERIKKELEAVRVEEARKMAQNLKERGGLKLEDAEIANLDTDQLVQMQVEQIEKEKRDLNERLRVIHRRMDHIERAYRREEIPLLGEDYERQKAVDLQFYNASHTTLLQAAKEKHEHDVEVKKRLIKILPDYKVLRAELEEKRKEEISQKKAKAQKMIEKEKAKRKAAAIQARKDEIARAEEEERLRVLEEERERKRAEEEARREEERKAEAAQKAEAEAARRAEREAERRKLDEIAEKQRQREREAEERLLAKREEERRRGAGSGSSTPSTGGAWRPTRASATATPDSRDEPSAGPPLFGNGGGWREKAAAKAQQGGTSTPATNGSSTPPRVSADSSPVPTGRTSAAGAPDAASKPSVYRPGAFAARKLGSGPSWREREAAKQQADSK
ncbi:hypothetical protein K437DRAFT_274144 [Tilletiaria anomala UBC 951]|uniref:Eukaryotic translation initiation factor 3 subunit A n=1 Tax=Tilletiaria anomala (strain ATCC 24038 / CBS 436.72 / UBC 951) TaxID=1037660 RepID=A0A066VVJ6_TILAU|nr:uncharacterized protein K437DRAFT_274144 [Tilletiaria anomala UBC 951]KDN45747.1 hypothetical protein K437DRAFT_274144 [Tilletiaria anomala UBC 951]